MGFLWNPNPPILEGVDPLPEGWRFRLGASFAPTAPISLKLQKKGLIFWKTYNEYWLPVSEVSKCAQDVVEKFPHPVDFLPSDEVLY